MNNIFRKIVNYLFKMYNELQNFGPPTNNMNGSNVDSDMSGTWYKTHPQFNGPDVLHVRDAIMDGNDMIVITDHGNMSMGEFANNYFKQSDAEYDLDGKEIINTATKPKLPLDSIPKPASTPKPSLPINNTLNIDYDVLVEGLESAPAPMDIINPSSYNKVEVPDNSAVPVSNDISNTPLDLSGPAPEEPTLIVPGSNINSENNVITPNNISADTPSLILDDNDEEETGTDFA